MKKKQFGLGKLFWFITVAAISLAILHTSITGYRTRTHKGRVAARRVMQQNERARAIEQGLEPPVQQEIDERLPPMPLQEIIGFAEIGVIGFFIYFIGKLMVRLAMPSKDKNTTQNGAGES